ncbi:hypothetical protein [Candidatus Soleaferrea massiliensis]|uniref:hypothetical protein n=1 Tax=Candidatus Soleaferrea massiliensis TaxID=1470354 RepID=UPI000590AC0D|nr:hypothetical protein [Candidatus Soleaferrea massiliensis]
MVQLYKGPYNFYIIQKIGCFVLFNNYLMVDIFKNGNAIREIPGDTPPRVFFCFKARAQQLCDITGLVQPPDMAVFRGRGNRPECGPQILTGQATNGITADRSGGTYACAQPCSMAVLILPCPLKIGHAEIVFKSSLFEIIIDMV